MNTIAGGIVLITNANSYYDNLIDEIPMNPKDRFIFLLENNWEEPISLKKMAENIFKTIIKLRECGVKSLKFKGLLQIYYLHRKMFKKVSKKQYPFLKNIILKTLCEWDAHWKL